MNSLTLQRVQFLPKYLSPGILYVSDEYQVAGHLCCCGCGNKVITPLGPAEWSVTEQDGNPSMWPSIGNCPAGPTTSSRLVGYDGMNSGRTRRLLPVVTPKNSGARPIMQRKTATGACGIASGSCFEFYSGVEQWPTKPQLRSR